VEKKPSAPSLMASETCRSRTHHRSHHYKLLPENGGLLKAYKQLLNTATLPNRKRRGPMHQMLRQPILITAQNMGNARSRPLACRQSLRPWLSPTAPSRPRMPA
jgi:hypothetical protein